MLTRRVRQDRRADCIGLAINNLWKMGTVGGSKLLQYTEMMRPSVPVPTEVEKWFNQENDAWFPRLSLSSNYIERLLAKSRYEKRGNLKSNAHLRPKNNTRVPRISAFVAENRKRPFNRCLKFKAKYSSKAGLGCLAYFAYEDRHLCSA